MLNFQQIHDLRTQALLALCAEIPELQETQLFLKLSALDGHDPELCKKTLELCLPIMDKLQPAPENGWLDALCAHLSANIYPDEQNPASPLSEAETLYLSVLELLFRFYDESSDPLTDFFTFDPAALAGSRVRAEYEIFEKAMRDAHIPALLRITREIRPFDPASHTIGVHNVALHTAVMAAKAGIKVDLPLVSAASAGHDIGKFGCRGADATRIPYLHYYYTWQWFSENGMENIGHVAANHSTWDLEFENLPIESLLLIYADFRVRGTRVNGKEQIRIYSLAESYDMIFSKLADMTSEKKQRYQTVYLKLRDFECLLTSHGVPTDIDTNALVAVQQKDASLLTTQEALQTLRSMTLTGSMRLMRMISTDPTLIRLLEQAKNEKTSNRIRTYLTLFSEYNTYMSKTNKKKLLALLYELLSHPDGDVRRTAGEIMGDVLANSGPKYRKERPNGAHEHAMTPTMMALLDESVELWQQYITLCLHPDRKNSPKHALRIANSLKTICQNLFTACSEKDAPHLLSPLLEIFYHADDNERFILADALCHVPSKYLAQADVEKTSLILQQMLHSDEPRQQLIAMRLLQHIKEIPAFAPVVQSFAAVHCGGEHSKAFMYLHSRIFGTELPALNEQEVSALYLSNLKNAVHWTVKLSQISLLCCDAAASSANLFHTALHLSNLLCVSEHLPVRESAGEHLLRIAPLLTVDQANEIVCDLLRELETGREQITRFIPPYIGRFICLLPEKELTEAVDGLESMIRGQSQRTACVALQAIGELIVSLPESLKSVEDRLLGLLMTGISHYDELVHQTALKVLCCDVFGNENMPLHLRGELFAHLHKKLLTLLSESRSGSLTMWNTAAMLNHLYRFIVQHEVQQGAFCFPAGKPVAFFPGTFDPFSVGHKQIVERIRALGMEIYLAIDEFSWSKKTLAKLLRRQIASISVADQWDTYLFPDEIPVNIAMPQDLAVLKELFPEREIYLVAGSDVILNASAYRSKELGSAAEYNHVIFYRGDNAESDAAKFEAIIRGKLQILSLPSFYDAVSSTRIREYVDRGLDISMLVDPVVQSFIYENGLYIREPESKNEISQQELCFRTHFAASEALPNALSELLDTLPTPIAAVLQTRTGTPIGWSVGHAVSVRDLYNILGSIEAANDIRQRVSGRLLTIDDIHSCQDSLDTERCRVLLNELLARALEAEYTYAICRCKSENTILSNALLQLGFISAEGCEDMYYVDMRAPVVLVQDVMLTIKQPLHDDPAVTDAVMKTRPRLRAALTHMFPGKLLLCFNSELLNQALIERVQKLNGVPELPPDVRLGKDMCVPYGKILSDVVIPHTVTKTLHVEKCFRRDLSRFEIVEFPNYSPLRSQVRMLKSFRRPVLLVDDLLHKGYRLEKLDKVFRQEGFAPKKSGVAIMSGRGQDLMLQQKREAECEYFISNLHYWVTESLLYPFIGGDSIESLRSRKRILPSINLILPYYYPNFFRGIAENDIRALSEAALQNALQIMQALEHSHQQLFGAPLTVDRLGEAIYNPRLPESGSSMLHDGYLPASSYLRESLQQLDRICRKERNEP